MLMKGVNKMQAVSQATLVPYEVKVWNENMVKFVGANQRLAVIRWKTTTDKETGIKSAPKSAMCVSLPVLEFAIEPVELTASVKDYLESQQDVIVRKIIDNHFSQNENVTLKEIIIPPAFLNVDGLAEFFKLTSTNGKISEEQIKSWFDSNLAEKLEIRLAALPGINDDILKKAMFQHKSLLAKLASPKAVISEKMAEQLLKVVTLDPDDFSGVKEALVNKLNGFKAKDEDLLASL
jgi:hypothetical protein